MEFLSPDMITIQEECPICYFRGNTSGNGLVSSVHILKEVCVKCQLPNCCKILCKTKAG